MIVQTRLQQVNKDILDALRQGFQNHYRGLAGSYKSLMKSKDAEEKQLGIFFCRLEYENLYVALQICLEKQEDFSILFCLTDFFELIQNNGSLLTLMTIACQHLETFPSDYLTKEFGYQIGFAFHRLANGFLFAKRFSEAKNFYQKAFDSYEQLTLIDRQQKLLWQTSSYHQLGRVAQELREWDDARHNYRQALEIYVEFADRYSQASTYYHLGRVAEEIGDSQKAINNYLQDLAITAEFNDEHGLGISMRNLARFCKSTPNPELLASVARILEFSESEIQQIFDSMDQGT